jgi:uncharacterized membrane protein YkoI
LAEESDMVKALALTLVAVLALCSCAPMGEDGIKHEEEEEITLDQCPAPVKATILKEAKGGKIEEIEKEVEDGKLLYEAELLIDGKEVEIKVAPDGKLLEKEVDD